MWTVGLICVQIRDTNRSSHINATYSSSEAWQTPYLPGSRVFILCAQWPTGSITFQIYTSIIAKDHSDFVSHYISSSESDWHVNLDDATDFGLVVEWYVAPSKKCCMYAHRSMVRSERRENSLECSVITTGTRKIFPSHTARTPAS